MSSLSVTPKKRSVLWRRIFLIEKVLVAIGFVVYALLVSINQQVSLWVTVIATLTVGNPVVPLALGSRRLYVAATVAVKLGRIFPRPSHVRRNLRRSLDTLPTGDQN